MAKRFEDTDKYKKSFIRNMPGAYKLLWDYICLNCDHAGVWQVDFEVAQIYMGRDMVINKDLALGYFNADEVRIEVIGGGAKWFIKPFVSFQYGALNKENRVHRSVLTELSKYDIKPLIRPFEGPKDKDKEKDMDKDRDKVGEVFSLPAWINKEVWGHYVDMRKKMKCPMTNHAKALAVTTLQKLKEQGQDPVKVLESSVYNSYRGLFPVKNNFSNLGKTPEQLEREHDQKLRADHLKSQEAHK